MARFSLAKAIYEVILTSINQPNQLRNHGSSASTFQPKRSGVKFA